MKRYTAVVIACLGVMVLSTVFEPRSVAPWWFLVNCTWSIFLILFCSILVKVRGLTWCIPLIETTAILVSGIAAAYCLDLVEISTFSDIVAAYCYDHYEYIIECLCAIELLMLVYWRPRNGFDRGLELMGAHGYIRRLFRHWPLQHHQRVSRCKTP